MNTILHQYRYCDDPQVNHEFHYEYYGTALTEYNRRVAEAASFHALIDGETTLSLFTAKHELRYSVTIKTQHAD